MDLSAPIVFDSFSSSVVVSYNSGSLHPMIARIRDGTRHPCAFSSTTISSHLACLANSSLSEPASLEQTNQDSKWVTTMRDEYNELIQNHTWYLVPYDPSMNVVNG